MGPSAATWKPVDGRQAAIFGTEEMSAGDANGHMRLNADLNTAVNSLKNVTITKATILQSYNTFSVPLGVTISCLPRNEVCDTGESYTFTTIPHLPVNTPSVIYEQKECQSQASDWR